MSSSDRIFNQLISYGKQIFLNKLIPDFETIEFDNGIKFKLTIDAFWYGENSEFPGEYSHSYLETEIIDPEFSKYYSVFTMRFQFDVDFEEITDYEFYNSVEFVHLTKAESFRKLEIYCRQLLNCSLDELCRRIQLLLVEMV